MENRTTIQLSEELRKDLKILAAKRDVSYQELLSDMISVFKELDREKTIVSIPAKLAEKIKTNLEKTDISSVSEYITFILRMALSEQVKSSDELKIKQRLKNLGYI